MERQHEVCTRVFRERLRSRLVDTKFLVRSKFPLSCFVLLCLCLTLLILVFACSWIVGILAFWTLLQVSCKYFNTYNKTCK